MEKCFIALQLTPDNVEHDWCIRAQGEYTGNMKIIRLLFCFYYPSDSGNKFTWKKLKMNCNMIWNIFISYHIAISLSLYIYRKREKEREIAVCYEIYIFHIILQFILSFFHVKFIAWIRWIIKTYIYIERERQRKKERNRHHLQIIMIRQILSLSPSLHPSQLFIIPNRSSWLHPTSAPNFFSSSLVLVCP